MRIHLFPIRSAMRGALEISTRRWGYITLHWLRRTERGYRPRLGLCVSPNATPWGATILWGREWPQYEKMMARLRRVLWGHGYSCDEHDPQRAEAYLASFAGNLPGEQSPTWIFGVLKAINNLRNGEGASVEILSDNPEADTIDQQAAVEVTDDWTGWEPRRFYGRDWALAVLEAQKASGRGFNNAALTTPAGAKP